MSDKKLSFSVQGSFITNLAREKFYYGDDFVSAIDLLKSCLVSDELTDAQVFILAVQILDGSKEIKGIYPGDDYGIYDVPEDKRPKKSIMSYFTGIRDEKKQLKEQNQLLLNKLACIAENISETDMQYIDAVWRSSYRDPEDTDRSIFGTSPHLVDSTASAVVKEVLGEDDPGAKLLEDYIDRMQSPCDEPDYGWLFPDGTFCAVDFGCHHGWAFEWLKKHDPQWADRSFRATHMEDAGAYLQEHYGCILLHNPAMGTAFVTAKKEPTKAQKEFLFDYYQKRGKNQMASDVYDEGRNWASY